MKSKLKYICNFAVLILIFYFTYRLMFDGQELSEILKDIRSASPGWILLGAAAAVLYVSCEGLVFYYMLHQFKQKTSLLRCIKYAFIGFFFCYITPSSSGGQPAQMYYMKKDGIKLGFSAIIMLLITVAYKSVLLILGAVFSVWKHDLIGANVNSLNWLILLGAVLNIGFIAALILLLRKPEVMRRAGLKIIDFLAGKKWIKEKRHTQLHEKINRICDNYSLGSNYIRENRKPVFVTFLITVAERLFQFSITWIVYRAYDLSGFSFWDIIALQVMIGVAVEMLPLPGAAGITEGCFLILFESIFTAVLVKPALLISRGLSFYLILVLGATVTLIAHLSNLLRDRSETRES